MLRPTVVLALLALPSVASGATPWLPPTAVAPAVRGAGPPAVAGNGAGRAVAAWSARDGVRVTLRRPGGPWFSPVRVPGSGRGATDVTVAMTDGGLAAVTWIQAGRVYASIRPARRRFLPAVAISPRGQLATSPHIAFGLACAPLIAWSAGPPDGASPSAVRAVCGGATGRFGPVATVSPPGEPASTPAVAGGRTGVIVLWRQDEGGTYRVRSATRGPAGGFSPPDSVSPPGTAVVLDPSVALAPDGTAIAAWTLTRSGSVVAQAAIRPITGGWSTPDDLSQPASQVRGARVALDGMGNAIAAWSRSGVIQVTTRPAGGPWATAHDLSGPGITAGGPALAMNSSGYAVVTWPAVEEGRAVAQASLRMPGGNFQQSATISDPGRPAIAPAAAIGDDGVAPVVWQWTDPVSDPSFAPSGVMTATGLAGPTGTGPSLVVDLRARPARVRPRQAVRITFGLSSPAHVRISARRANSSAEAGAITLTGTDGANTIVLSGVLGGASLGRGRWIITATPHSGTGRSLVLVVV